MSELKRKMFVHADRAGFGVVGEKGGVHFWVTQHKKAEIEKHPCLDKSYGGVEQHSRVPMYEGQTQRREDVCWLIGGKCYHDGSSLYAEEVYIPLFSMCNDLCDFEPLWRKLEGEYASRFQDAE